MGDLTTTRVVAGQVVAAAGSLGVTVAGTVVDATWPGGYIPTEGDPVRVLLGDGTATVLGPATSTPRPSTGTVAGAAANGTVPVTVPGGTVQARYVGTAPGIGTLVFLDWQATTPRLIPGTVATITPPTNPTPTPTPDPPPVVETGTLTVPAIDSGSWQVGGTWAWAGTDVYQWRYGSNRENRGAWFYGDAPTQLAGRTVTGLRIRLGARLRLGSYNDALPLHVYRTSDRTRPGGDVNRVGGGIDITLPPGAAPWWYSLPTDWGQALVDGGGGIAVAGAPYLAVQGITDPASGQLAIDWRR